MKNRLMKSCWINDEGRIQCPFDVHCYDVVKPEDSHNWMAKGRYIPLSEGLRNLFENLVCHKQPGTVITRMNRLIELDTERRDLDKCKIMRKKFFEFKVIDEMIVNEAATLIEYIKRERLYFNQAPRDLSDNLPVLSSNHGLSFAILEDLQEKRKEPEIVIVVDGHFDFHAFLTIARIKNFIVDKHIDEWGKKFDSRHELIAFLQAHEDKKHHEVNIPINRAEWLKDCFFSMPDTSFIHIGADWKDTKFSSNEIMKRVFKMDIYPHLYSDLIKWSENDLKIRELKKLIQNKAIYLSIDVDGIAGIPSTYSLAEPKRRNQISKKAFKAILRTCRKYAKDIKLDISELSMHEKENVTEGFLKYVFTVL